MKIKPVIAQQTPHTNQLHFLSGAYRRSKFPIPYLSLTMNFLEAANSLNLASELPGAEDVAWEIEELYQRDIDWTRVRDRIVPYLNNHDAPNFFNSITIAALPYDPNSSSLLENFSDEIEWKAPELDGDFAKKLTIGPISLGYYDEWQVPTDPEAQLGAVRWNPMQLFGVAIDGQHRLAAIKSLVDKNKTDPRHGESRVPVLLLILDPALGYVEQSGSSTIEVIRRLFIDLNKHAQSVTRARQILLDDHEPHSIAVRRLIGTRLSPDLAECVADPPRYPLSLVDWFSEQAKVEKGPFVTTVLTVDWLISKVLGSGPLSDYTAYTSVQSQLKELKKSLALNLETAEARLSDMSSIKLGPFEYYPLDLAAISYSFGAIWSRPIVRLLTEFEPYKDLISRRLADDSLSLEFQDWYRLYSRANGDSAAGRNREEYDKLLERLKQPRPGHIAIGEGQLEQMLNKIQAVKDGNGLAYKVVFQKALLEAMVNYSKLSLFLFDDLFDEDEEIDFEIDSLDAETDEEAAEPAATSTDDEMPIVRETSFDIDISQPPFEDGKFGYSIDQISELLRSDHSDVIVRVQTNTDEFVDFMNRIVSSWPDFLMVSSQIKDKDNKDSYFWLGTIRKAEGDIDFTQAAASRATNLIFMSVLLIGIRDAGENADFEQFEDLWSRVQSGDLNPAIHALAKCVREFSKDDSSAAGRILKSRDQDFDQTSAREECRIRLAHIWQNVE